LHIAIEVIWISRGTSLEKESLQLARDNPMEINFIRISPSVITKMDRDPLMQKSCGAGLAEMRYRQSCKIRQIRDALTAAGFITLDEQAKALGLCRSTTWTIVNGSHKGSGLSATTINHISRAPPVASGRAGSDS
jgi:hypothetical protein